MQFQHVTTRVTGPAGYLVGLSDLLIRTSGMSSLVYSVSATDGGVLVLGLNNGMQVLDQAAFPSDSVALDAPRQLAEAVVNGVPSLISFGHFGTTIDVFPLDAQGLITQPYILNWQANSGMVVAATATEFLSVGGQSFFASASRQTDGLTIWETTAQNVRPIAQPATADLLPANGVFAMAQVVLGGEQHLLVLSAGSTELLNYRLGSTGLLTLLSRIDARDGLAIGTGSALEVVQVGGRAYALVGASGSHSLAVVALEAGGQMVVTDHVMDDLNTRFGGLSEIAKLTHNGQVFIAAAGWDDGVSLMTLLPNGRLVHLATIVDDKVMALTNVSGLALRWQNGQIEILASGGTGGADAGSGITQLFSIVGTVELPQMAGALGETLTGGAGRDQLIGGLGSDRLEGGAGNDILVDGGGIDSLIGGAGADVFIFHADGATDTILDFERGIDRIDLSAFGRIYSMDALTYVESSNGAEIRYGNETIIVQTSDGQRLFRSEVNIDMLLDLTHIDVTPMTPDLVPAPFTGTGGPDYIDGRDGHDRLVGGGGADTLLGAGGNDTLIGGSESRVFDTATGQVYRLYQATLDRAPDLNGLLSWTNMLVAGTRNLSEITTGFVNSNEFRTTYGNLDTDNFVTLLYANVLDRSPDPTGFQTWTGFLNAGTRSREQVVTGFSESVEFKQKSEVGSLAFSYEGVKMELMDDVFRLYQAVLGRAPDMGGFNTWLERLAGGTLFTNVISGFVNSREFQNKYGQTTNQEFVTLLYANVLNRMPDSVGLDTWVGRLQSGTHTREQVVFGFVQSREFITKTVQPLQDWVLANGADDVLFGGTGNNLLFGGLWSDTFVFRSDTPSDNWVVGLEPWDKLNFQGFGYMTPENVFPHMQETAGTTVFNDRGVTVHFDHTSLAEVMAAGFVF